MSSFKNSTPWAIEAQRYVAGELAGKFDTEFVDAYKTMEYGVEGQFAHAKPKIMQDTKRKDVNMTEIDSFSHQGYSWRTSSSIDAADYYAAYEVGVKMKSREAIYKYFGVPFTVKESTCREINEMAYGWVKKNWSGDKAVMDRFEKYGQPMEFVPDYQSGSGITWVNEYADYHNTTTTY